MLSPALNQHAPAKFWQAGTEPPSPLFEAVVCDTHTAALLTVVIASAVNGFKTPGLARTGAQLEMYVPQSSTVTQGFGRWAAEADVKPATIASIAAFFADLEPARRQLGRYFQDANTLGPERAAALHRFALSGVWRGVCHSAHAAILLLNAETDQRLPEFYTLNGGILMRLLQAAATGETPCIDKTGNPFLPALPQRRRSSRRAVGQSALVTINGSTLRAFVRDVSAGGFGLEQVPILQNGAAIRIELSTGRRFAGTVAWYGFQRSILGSHWFTEIMAGAENPLLAA